MMVLHLAAGNLFGGVERLLVTLAECRELCSSMAPEFALCFDNRLAAELRRAAVPVHMLAATRARRPLTVLRARRRLRALIAERRFDVAVCHSAWSHALFGPVCRGLGIPLIFWLHDTIGGGSWEERWARRTPPDLIIANSHFTGRGLKNIFPASATAFLYYPVKPPAAGPVDRVAVRTELDTEPDARVFVQVSRMEMWKGHTLHLEALRELANVPKWTCWMIGGPQRPFEERYFEQLKELARRYQIAHRVRFLGSRSDVNRLLAAADIFCQPNIGPEPFGIVFVEALMSGLPVVSTDIGGVREIVDPSCGILVELGRPSALAGALRTLIEDDGLRLRLASGASRRARLLCDPRIQISRLAELLSAQVRPLTGGIERFERVETRG